MSKPIFPELFRRQNLLANNLMLCCMNSLLTLTHQIARGACLATLIALPAGAATTNLECVADTTLFEPSPDNNIGGLSFFNIGINNRGQRARGLVRFDPAAAIPAGSTINSASLELSVLLANGNGQTYNLHRMLVSWTEGNTVGTVGMTNVGGPAQPGETTWSQRAFGSLAWGTPGAQAGVDFSNTVSASGVMSFSALSFSSAGSAADVQAWLDSPVANHGWLILLAGEAASGSASRINSSESASKPVLTVNYTLPALPTPPTLYDVATTANGIRFSFDGQAGRSYIVESRLSLGSDWSTLVTIPALAGNGTVHVTNSISADEKYYRVSTP